MDMPKTKQPKWTKEEIRAMLVKSDKALCRGLMTIYGYQTAEEQSAGQTVEDNGMGFNGLDADFLTQMALYFQRTGRLTPGQMEHTRKAMLKYSGQLTRHANANHPKVTSNDLHNVDPA
jgi:hypothetical protein